MDINFRDKSNENVNNILSIVREKQILEKLLKYYQFSKIDISILVNILYAEFEHTIRCFENGTFKDFVEELKKNFVFRVDDIISLNFYKNKDYSIIINFISENIENPKTIEEATRELSKIVRFTRRIKIRIDMDYYMNLLSCSSKFFDMVKFIIDNSKINENFDKDVNTIIEAYIVLNGIKVEDTEQVEPEIQGLLTREDEIDLFSKFEQGDKTVKDIIVRKNLGLLKIYASRYSGFGLDFEDLFQEGSFGLMRAIERFDYRKGYKFSTYATWWIRCAMTRALSDKSRTIRIPVQINEQILKYQREYAKLENTYSEDIIDKIIGKSLNLSEDRIKLIRSVSAPSLSLNVRVGDEKESEFGDFIIDETSEIENVAFMNILKDQIEELFEISNLSEREIFVIKCRFGLRDNRIMTLEEIGQILNVTRERIRQIQNKALKKMKATKYAKSLVSFIGVEELEEKKEPSILSIPDSYNFNPTNFVNLLGEKPVQLIKHIS